MRFAPMQMRRKQTPALQLVQAVVRFEATRFESGSERQALSGDSTKARVSAHSQPIFYRQAGNAKKMAQIVRDANRTCSDCLRSDHGVGAPNLLASLPQIALDQEGLVRCSGIKRCNAHYLEPSLESDTFGARLSRPSDASPNFHGGQC